MKGKDKDKAEKNIEETETKQMQRKFHVSCNNIFSETKKKRYCYTMTGGKKELLEINCHKTSKIKKSIKWLKVKMEDVTQKVEQKN